MFETASMCIRCNPEDIAPTVLMPGDPLRAHYIARYYLENAKQFNTVRNMLGFTGFYKDECVSVMGSGMGVPSITLYAHELFTQFGVKTIIRTGTAGALKEDMNLRDLVVSESAATDSAIAGLYGFVASDIEAPSIALLTRALEVCKDEKVPHHVGKMFTTDLFYDERSEALSLMHKEDAFAVDMETAGLYMEAQIQDTQALSICTISNSLITGERLTAQELEQGLDTMIRVALECV